MTPYKKRSCPITQRLAEDLMIRNMADATIDAYTYHVRRFADFIQKPLDRVTPEDVRRPADEYLPTAPELNPSNSQIQTTRRKLVLICRSP